MEEYRDDKQHTDDKAAHTLPQSPAQLTLARIERRDKRIATFKIFLLLIVVIFNVLTALRLQQVIDENQAETQRAREANIARQDEIKEYIKCVLLIRFDYTPEQLSSKEQVESALDTCANPKRLP
jgi:hypothetical protein